MTTKKYADQIKKQCKSIVNISLEPIFENYIVDKNGKRIGVLYNEKLYLLSTKNLKKLLPDASEENPFGWAYYRLMYVENTEDITSLEELITTVYNDLYFQKEFVCDISSLIQSYSNYPEIVEKIYNYHLTFLKFCTDNELLKIKPLDKSSRIIWMNYTNNELTEKGMKIFPVLYNKWLAYNDKNDGKSDERSNNIKMLEKFYLKIASEVGIGN